MENSQRERIELADRCQMLENENSVLSARYEDLKAMTMEEKAQFQATNDELLREVTVNESTNYTLYITLLLYLTINFICRICMKLKMIYKLKNLHLKLKLKLRLRPKVKWKKNTMVLQLNCRHSRPN